MEPHYALRALSLQVLGANASGFQVPVGQQPAAGPAGQQQPGLAPFGWPAFGGGCGAWGGGAAGGAAGPTFNAAQAPNLDFGAPQPQGQFVFGAAQQPQQQHSQPDMME